VLGCSARREALRKCLAPELCRLMEGEIAIMEEAIEER
jgi:hypothetical protein